MGNREKKQQKSTLFIGRRIFHTLALLLIVYCSLLIVNCPNSLVRSALEPITVIFDTNGGSKIKNQSVYRDHLIKRPSNPSKWGYAFEEWCTDNSLQQMWDFYSVPQDDPTTLYAKWDVDDTNIIGMNGQAIPGKKGEIKNVTVRNGECPVFSVNEGFYNPSWMLNGIDVGMGEYFFNTSVSDKELGKSYTLSLNVENGGKYYSSYITIRILNAEITVRKPPRLSYAEGNMLDLSGLEVTLAYDDGTKENVSFSSFASRNISVSLDDLVVANGMPLSHLDHHGKTLSVSYDKQNLPVGTLTVN